MVSNGQIEDRWKKHANKMTKIQWTKRSVSVPKSHRGETNKMEIPASEQCNSVQTPMVAESLFELSLEKGVDDKDKSIFDKPREITAIPFEKAPTEMVHATRMIRSQSVKLIDPYSCFPNLAEKNYLDQPGSFVLSASMKGSVSSTGEPLSNLDSIKEIPFREEKCIASLQTASWEELQPRGELDEWLGTAASAAQLENQSSSSTLLQWLQHPFD